MVQHNKLLGQFRLEGIPAAPRGVPQIEVTFDIDANGIVHVSACDKATNKEQKIIITSSSGIDKTEIERLIKEAQEHEAEDHRIRETIEKKNKLDGLICEFERTLSENKDKLSESESQPAHTALEKAKEALKEHESDGQKLQEAYDELTHAAHQIAQTLYQKNKEKAPDQGSGEAKPDEPIEGEVK